MPNVRASSGMIGTTRGPMCSSRARLRSRRVKPIVVRHLLVARPAAQLGERLVGRQLERAAGRGRALGHRPAERPAALHHVLVLDGVLGRDVVRRVVGVDRVLGDLVVQVQPVAQGDELVLGHLLDLVGGVAALEALAERPALDRLAQDHGRRAAAEVLGRRLVGGVELAVVVAAAGQVAQLVVGEVGDHLAQARVGPEEVVADVLAGLDGVALELAVDGGVHLVERARRPCPWPAARPTSSPRSP